MIVGISLQAHPTEKQKLTLSQWMGCARFIWNAKCDEDHYLRRFANSYLPVKTYPKIDQSFSRYKDSELSPWLFDCPSQILRNSASSWYFTYKNFLKGLCGRPNRKRKGNGGSILLTKELFRFERCEDGVVRLFIGAKKNNIGYLSIKNHSSYQEPNSIRIKQKNGRYTVSFCYENSISDAALPTQKEHLNHLRNYTHKELQEITVGIDRGVKRPVQAGEIVYDLTPEQKQKKKAKERYIRRCQRSLSRRHKGSKRRRRQKRKLAKAHEKIRNIRKDFCHKTSRAIVDDKNNKVIVLEDLKTKKMTRAPKAKKDEKTGKWLKNKAGSKARLNRSILDKGWFLLELFIFYKAFWAGKAVFKVSAQYTSQECADCGHTHPDNRKSQERFHCVCCGHSDNADHNAAEVIKKRAINLILDSGTELSSRSVLLDSGRGATHQTRGANANRASGREVSKKKRKAIVA